MLTLLAATALAAPTLTVRRDCDAAGGLPTKESPLTVAYASEDGTARGEVKLGTLEASSATSRFALLLTGGLVEVRTFVVVAYNNDGAALGKAIADVDVTTGEVTGLDGSGVSIRSVVPGEDDSLDVEVTLHDKVAEYAAMVTLTDVTGDGAVVQGDAFEQAVALLELTEAGRAAVSRYTFDDAHGIDSARQTWSGTFTVDQTYQGVAFEFSARADRCLPEGVESPADGTVEWTEALVLQGSDRKPKWKSVTLGLREAETETWLWPFVARLEDTPSFLLVSLDATDGAVEPRAEKVLVRVPARETLSGTTALDRTSSAETLTVTVHPAGQPKQPLTTFVVTRTADGVTVATTSYLELSDEKDVLSAYDSTKESYFFANGPGRAGRGGSARYEDDGWALSTVTLSGPEEVDWDGTIEVAVSGDAVWDDLDVTATLVGATSSTVTFPLTSLRSVFEGVFVFDANPSGGVYGWDCVGCGDDFEPFERQAGLGVGTRTSSSQASTKAELL